MSSVARTCPQADTARPPIRRHASPRIDARRPAALVRSCCSMSPRLTLLHLVAQEHTQSTERSAPEHAFTHLANELFAAFRTRSQLLTTWLHDFMVARMTRRQPPPSLFPLRTIDIMLGNARGFTVRNSILVRTLCVGVIALVTGSRHLLLRRSVSLSRSERAFSLSEDRRRRDNPVA